MADSIWPLVLLWLSGFTSATILPGNSEAALLLYLSTAAGPVGAAVFAVSCGNVLGGLTTVLLGCAAPAMREHAWLGRLRRYGPVVTVLAPLPLIGDAIAAAAGWLRLPLLPVIAWMTLGRVGRYLLLVWWMG